MSHPMARVLLVLVGLALVAGGCGGSEAEDPLAALDAAAKKTKAAESNRQQFKMELEGGGEEQSMSGEATLSADSTRGHMTFEAEGDQLDGSFEAILVDGVFYMKGDQLPIPEGKEWLKAYDPPTSTMSPSEFVQFLRDSGDVENEGTEEIRGQQTTHYSGPLNIRKIAEAGGSELVQRLNQQPHVDDYEVTIDIWVGESGLPARMEVEPSRSARPL
jgi:outer membrane lipoprotein-sorting protein